MSRKKKEEKKIYPKIDEESCVLINGVIALFFGAMSLSIMII
jgi:hypothetical protein